MPRHTKKAKTYIQVFCEGESEQVYTDFLKEYFSDVAVIKRSKKTGTFEKAASDYRNNIKYKSEAEITDEIWFFFDVEIDDISKWDARYRIINGLRTLRKKNGIKVRLLMTTGCIEYWLLLHFRMLSPPISFVADKERMIVEVKHNEPAYKKGDHDATFRIAENYPTAVENARRIVKNLLTDGLPTICDTDERNEWLYKNSKTFSTVYEAIDFLESLQP